MLWYQLPHEQWPLSIMRKLQYETHAVEGLYQRGEEQAIVERDWNRDIPTFQHSVPGTVTSQKHRSIYDKRPKRDGETLKGSVVPRTWNVPVMATRSYDS